MEIEEQYRISELARKAGVSKRTVHYYINKGLIPPAAGAGIASYYTEDHLHRILLIKKLQERYLPLEKVKNITAALTLQEVKQKLEFLEDAGSEAEIFEEEKDAAIYSTPGAAAAPAGAEYIKVDLGLGVELFYPKGISKEGLLQVTNIVSYGRKLFNKENC